MVFTAETQRTQRTRRGCDLLCEPLRILRLYGEAPLQHKVFKATLLFHHYLILFEQHRIETLNPRLECNSKKLLQSEVKIMPRVSKNSRVINRVSVRLQ